ncbi:MAG: nucleotidyltransferase family protein [Deltaproteobacteria bacterium]|nr:MAG: nucleotidyltransferase family protein [Deltaproteobacteria bacterium]
MSATGSSPRRALVMAGGLGRRLRPHSRVLPKPLMLVRGVPLLDIIIGQLAAQAFDEVVISLGHLGDLVRSYCDSRGDWGVAVSYLHEDTPQGTAGALRELPGFHEPVLVVNGDLLTDIDFARLLDDHRRSGALLTIAACEQHHDVPFGVVEFGPDHRLVRFREKPRLRHWVSTGIYAVSPAVRDVMPASGPVGFDEVVRRLTEGGEAPRVHPHEGLWMDLARVEAFDRAEELAARLVAGLPPTGGRP